MRRINYTNSYKLNRVILPGFESWLYANVIEFYEGIPAITIVKLLILWCLEQNYMVIDRILVNIVPSLL